MVDIKALFEYNWYCRGKFLDTMAMLPWEKLVENREASFNSMRNIFVHSLEAEQRWIRRLSTGEWAKGHIYDQDMGDIKSMRKFMKEVEAESQAYLSKLKPEDFDKILSWPSRDGTTKVARVEDILVHIVEEEIHHRGEILCLMWQINTTPPYTSYTAYLDETKR